jgi:myosin V
MARIENRSVYFYMPSCIFILLILTLHKQVAYDTSGFLEKNRDLLHMDSIQLLAKCKSSLPQMFASKMLSQSESSLSVSPRSSAADSQKLSVAMKFKVRISMLPA